MAEQVVRSTFTIFAQTALPLILAFELFLGGQARLTDRITPGLHKQASRKASGYYRWLNFLPVDDAETFQHVIGGLMIFAGILICVPPMRAMGTLLSMALSGGGVYSHRKMGVPYWLPAVNTAIAVVILWQHELLAPENVQYHGDEL
ncbi:hypothetical protein BAUCODRAFT_78334 [Baudoinia panamericana UAMH 10762]|uniref:DoxX family protein n=1 Tax=Baudoinia panamericana (strain UAMH 10762) TaxID=717646 RepID=M2M763_BAUPA|nr:uncharacterized protein BAUCODRAFT_78334 [Baudoinia panamericana UAMH 10762]EMC92141.1 hypothetical protein BAUCODRAFT_78334 [Baudoinia panamericana UAMH 10762]